MTAKALKTVLSEVETSKTVLIWEKLADNYDILLKGDPEDFSKVVSEVNKVSEGMGLQIIKILMWQDDTLDKFFDIMAKEILYKLNDVHERV
jgi:hypothetical protein